MIKPASRKTKVVTQRPSKYVTVTRDTDEERFNVPYLQTYSWEKKLAVLMLPRFQGFLQSTKTLVLKPGKRFTSIYYEGEYVSPVQTPNFS